ncbi:MAG: YkgJ family cysteine cluster protein [Blastocatellia bacterium]
MGVTGNGNSKKPPRSLRVMYNCSKCPAYCCSYDRVEVTRRDLLRIAAHFGISYQQAEKRYTKSSPVGQILRHQKDHIYRKVCEFLDTEKRQCTIYEARPAVCRGYPESLRCGYYDFLANERRRQCDPDFIPFA